MKTGTIEGSAKHGSIYDVTLKCIVRPAVGIAGVDTYCSSYSGQGSSVDLTGV